MDTANPTPALLLDVVRLTDRIPNLRLVIDHLPQLEPPADAPARRGYEGTLRQLGQRPQIYLKISEVLRRVDGRVPLDLKFYKPRLDELWDIFGEDRLIYGSDWPNSDLWGPYPQMLTVVREYFMSKGAAAAEKYFWKNSVAAYRWVKREPNQPQP
jgi:predicted TIM-barrel fold metal-dependent hydrolase